MKVAVIGLRGFPGVPGGVETHAQQLYPRLAARGCDVLVFTRKPYVDATRLEWRGVALKALPCPKRKFLEAIVHSYIAVLAARKEKPDLLHVHAIGPSLAIPLARLLGMRVVVTHHGPDYERKKWGALSKKALQLGELFARRLAHQIICVAPNIADRIRLTSRSEPIVIPNGVEIPKHRAAAGTLERFHLQPGRYILAVGRFVPEKSFHDLLAAFEMLRRQNGAVAREWKLVLAGSTDHADDYSRKLWSDAERVEGVVLTGYVTGARLSELFSNAGLFVLPSSYEGLPIALLEAMSYGLSCVASDIPANTAAGLPDHRLFSCGDVEALAERIAYFVANPMEPDERDAQLARLKESFDWDKIADRTLAVYRSVTRDAGRVPIEPVPVAT